MYNLVLVEDDYQIRTGLSNFFPWNQLGFKLMHSFSNGKTAFEYIVENKNIDVVLTDIRMPLMDGLELADKINSFNHDIVVIILTAFPDFEYAQKAIKFNVRNYIIKTSNYDEIVNAFQNIKKSLDDKLIRSISLPSLKVGNVEPDKELIGKIINFINDNIEAASLQNVADKFNMNPNYLSHYFREHTGVNFSDYTFEVKMKLAIRYLNDPKMSIMTIGEILGYSNDKNFSRAFKSFYHVSPANYRKINK